MTPQSLINRLLVTIDKKYNDMVGDLLIDTTLKPGWHATVTGKVVSVPEQIDKDPFRRYIVHEVQVDDEVAFSYQVVFDTTHSDNAMKVFEEEGPISAFVTSWSNRIGERLVIVYRKNGIFSCGHYDPDGREVDRLEKASMAEKENWLGRFVFNETNDVSYNNLLTIEGKDYWMVDYSQVYAVKREGEIIMIGGYVMVDPINDMNLDDSYQGPLELYNAPRRKIEWDGRGRVLEIGKPLTNRKPLAVNKGDIVVFDKRYAEQYVFWGRDVVLVKQERVRARILEGSEAL